MLLAALLALASPALGQDWSPPSLEVAAPATSPEGARVLSPAAVGQFLERRKGAGGEAARAAAFASGRETLWLVREAGGWRLGSRGASVEVSEELAAALRRVDAYFSLAEPTLANPITHAELSAALLSAEGVAKVRALFDSMIERRVVVQRIVIVPERGGEATLDSGLAFNEWEDPTRRALPKLAAAIDDDDELARLYAAEPGVRDLDEHGLLKRLLESLPRWKARGDPPDRIAKIRRLTVTTLLQNGGDAFLYDPASQLDAIAAQDWRGRFVGRWHTHPPHFQASGWGPSGEPSFPDLEIASQSGQNLTLSFHADGFDAWDLSALEGQAPSLALARPIRYRSAAWRSHFDARHDEVRRALGP